MPQLLHFRIGWYSTTSTAESVFIIGGKSTAHRDLTDKIPSSSYFDVSTIAEYKNGKWRKIGDMVQARRSSIAYIFGSSMKIIGGRFGRSYEESQVS